jgi:hypothetical protein
MGAKTNLSAIGTTMTIFLWCITLANLVLSALNLWMFYKLRPYSKRQLEKYSRQWTSNLNYEQARKVVDEANKTQSSQ